MRDAIPLHIWLVGERQVGKSTFLKQVLGYTYRGSAMKYVHDCLVDGVHVSVNIYDLPNDSSTLPAFNRHGNCVFMFDITRPSTLNAIDAWRKNVWCHTDFDNNSYNDIHVIANKMDLAGDAFNLEDVVHALGEDVRLFRVSARSGDVVKEAFEHIIRDALDKHMNMMFVDFENF